MTDGLLLTYLLTLLRECKLNTDDPQPWFLTAALEKAWSLAQCSAKHKTDEFRAAVSHAQVLLLGWYLLSMRIFWCLFPSLPCFLCFSYPSLPSNFSFHASLFLLCNILFKFTFYGLDTVLSPTDFCAGLSEEAYKRSTLVKDCQLKGLLSRELLRSGRQTWVLLKQSLWHASVPGLLVLHAVMWLRATC